jgi:phosphoglycerate dehydrogenase-like enzyme
MKALFTYIYKDEWMKKITDLGYEVIHMKEKNAVYSDNLSEVEVLVCYNPFDLLDIKQMKMLKLIQLSSTGIDQIPEDIDPKILIANNHGGYSIPIGEWTVHKILEIFKDARYFHRIQQEHLWKINTNLLEVKGKKIAFLGMGTLAGESAKRLQGFDAEVIGFSQSGQPKTYFDKTYTMDILEEKISQMDVIVIALPHTPQTHHLVDARLLSLMKEGAVLINISRGKVLDEKALIEQHEKFLGIALDVFENEPLDKESPLWDLENLYLSPHNSWVSEMRNKRRFDLIYDNLKAYSLEGDIKNQVDLKRGY